MSSGFTIEIKLLSGKRIRVPELLNKQYIHIVKYCENKDYEGLYTYLTKLLNIPSDIDILDLLYLLIYYRIVFVSGNIVFKNKKNLNLEFDLNICLEKLENIYTSVTHNVITDNIQLTLGLPRALFYQNIGDIYNSVIYKVTLIGSKELNYCNLSEGEQSKVFSLLPASTIKVIQDHTENISRIYKRIILIDSNKEFGLDEYSVNLFSNDIIDFISVIFSHNILDFMEVKYGFISKISSSPEFFDQLSPIDSRLILNIHNKEVEKANKELQKQQSNTI